MARAAGWTTCSSSVCWRSLKYECVYLHAFENGTEARQGIGNWVKFYCAQRPHSALASLHPDEAYAGAEVWQLAA